MINQLLSVEVKEKYKLIVIDNIDKVERDEFIDAMNSINGLLDEDGKIIYLFIFGQLRFFKIKISWLS